MRKPVIHKRDTLQVSMLHCYVSPRWREEGPRASLVIGFCDLDEIGRSSVAAHSDRAQREGDGSQVPGAVQGGHGQPRPHAQDLGPAQSRV